MKKIGKEVLFLDVGEKNPRNGEGTFIRLKDGSILYSFTEYYGDCGKDHGTARISAVLSKDEGESWSDRFVLIEKDEKAQNIMSTNLLRLANGDLGIIYLRKEIDENERCICMPVFRHSKDEGKSWSDFTYCTNFTGYYCPFNGSATVLKSGRIIIPLGLELLAHDSLKTGKGNVYAEGGAQIVTVYSDDNGKTWHELAQRFFDPHGIGGITEPSVYEHQNGDLWIWFRTQYGNQYQSVSKDGGSTWSAVTPNFLFTTPDSPMQVERVGKYTVSVFNPVPFYVGNGLTEYWGCPKRTPFAVAVSENDGVEFSSNNTVCDRGALLKMTENICLLEDDTSKSYCYPCIYPVKDGFLVGYYHQGNTHTCLACGKISKVYYSELEK